MLIGIVIMLLLVNVIEVIYRKRLDGVIGESSIEMVELDLVEKGYMEKYKDNEITLDEYVEIGEILKERISKLGNRVIGIIGYLFSKSVFEYGLLIYVSYNLSRTGYLVDLILNMIVVMFVVMMFVSDIQEIYIFKNKRKEKIEEIFYENEEVGIIKIEVISVWKRIIKIIIYVGVIITLL